MVKKQNHLQKEQQELSMLMLQLLVEIYGKKDLVMDHDGNVVSVWTTDDNNHLYDIWGERIEGKQTYWIRVQNGSGMVTFGRMPNDGTYFRDDGRNYLEVMYNLPPQGYRRGIGHIKNPHIRDAAWDLWLKDAKPNLDSEVAWDASRMKVFPYLKQVLHR